MDGYADITLRAGLRLGQHLALAVGLENLLDSAFKTFASGAYAPGRNVLLSVRGTL